MSYDVASKEVTDVAEKVVAKHKLDDVKAARIHYLFDLRKNSEAGECRLAGKLLNYLTGYNYIIEFNKQLWDLMKDEQKEALVYHELIHICKREDKKGNIRWRIRKHSVEEFIEVADCYGTWLPELKTLKEALNKKNKESK